MVGETADGAFCRRCSPQPGASAGSPERNCTLSAATSGRSLSPWPVVAMQRWPTRSTDGSATGWTMAERCVSGNHVAHDVRASAVRTMPAVSVLSRRSRSARSVGGAMAATPASGTSGA